MMIPRPSLLLILLCLCFPVSAAKAGGKHLEVMAPLCKQHDLKGKPHKVSEHRFESEDGGEPKLEARENSDYDEDGNALRREKFDGSNQMTALDVYGYDASGTWISLKERSEGAEKTYQIYIDTKTKRIAKVDTKDKTTEFISYTERGFESGTATQTAQGRVVEKTTITRNAADKEERVVFEEPAGTKTTEILVRWTPEGFQDTYTMIFQDRDGDTFVTTYEYLETDAVGNWLSRIERTTIHMGNGERRPLPLATVERSITYHP